MKGGLALSQSITAPEMETCKLNAPLIVSEFYKQQFITLENGDKLEIEDIESQCIEIKESI